MRLRGLVDKFNEEKKRREKKRKKGGRRDKTRDKIRKNIRFEGILRRERVCCSEHGATAWPILHTASTLRSL